MNMIGIGSKMINRMSIMSPAGMILVGGAAALAFPAVRHGLRSAAVIATRGVLAAAGTVQSTAASVREGMEDIIAEARAASEDRHPFMTSASARGRRLAINAAAGALAVHEGLRNIVEEAREERLTAPQEETPATVLTVTYPDPEAPETATDTNEPPSPRRRRSRSQEL